MPSRARFDRSYSHYSREDPPSRGRLRYVSVALALLIVGAAGVMLWRHYGSSTPQQAATSTHSSAATKQPTGTTPGTSTAATTDPTNYCASNQDAQNVIVSITARHLWACNGTTQAYDSAVVTGMENLPADLTPTGTYHIYSKQTDLYLDGSDSTGSWHDYVYYWMPFLSNQYGVYGFHDATWRQPNDFGNISPYSSNASHGCVELPLATAKWLYNWAAVGTTVTVQT